MARTLVQRLKAKGFDKSYKPRGEPHVHVGCSQCQALVINGVACHEKGLPQPEVKGRFKVYLLHFERPYVSPGGRQVRHYLGATRLSIEERMRRHTTERGAALLRAVHKAGIKWEVVRVWTRSARKLAFQLEIRLKKRHRHTHWCPHCRAQTGVRTPRHQAGNRALGGREGRGDVRRPVHAANPEAESGTTAA